MKKHYNKPSLKQKRRYLRGNMTYCERLVWIYLRKRRMNERFLRQYSVDNYIIDFYCPKLKIAVEVDGDVHEAYGNERRDKKRQEYLEKFGISFVRFTNEELLGNPNMAFEKIEKEINRKRE